MFVSWLHTRTTHETRGERERVPCKSFPADVICVSTRPTAESARDLRIKSTTRAASICIDHLRGAFDELLP